MENRNLALFVNNGVYLLNGVFGEIKKKKKKWMDEWRREAIQDFAVLVILLFIWNKKYYFWFVEWIVIPKIRWFLD